MPYHQVLLTAPDKSDKFRIYSLSIDSSTGGLSLPSSDQEITPSGINVKKDGVAYASPLCASRDGSHVFVIYTAENVGFISSFVMAV